MTATRSRMSAFDPVEIDRIVREARRQRSAFFVAAIRSLFTGKAFRGHNDDSTVQGAHA